MASFPPSRSDTDTSSDSAKKEIPIRHLERVKSTRHLETVLLTEDEKERLLKIVTEEYEKGLIGSVKPEKAQIEDEEKEREVQEEETKDVVCRRPTLPRGRLGSSGRAFANSCVFSPDYDCQDCSYVRKPRLQSIIQSTHFKTYKHRFRSAQVNRTLHHPALYQPKMRNEKKDLGEQKKTREKHSFVICADTQFGILMDGIPMKEPNWDTEVDLSRRAVEKINAMKPKPLFVCVCGDLVDTESSFSSATASWKKIMRKWEHEVIMDQQNRDWKKVWAQLDPSIALVCLCGNHDVGNRPTEASIDVFRESFGDEYLSFWANGTYNICINNVLFFDPTGAPKMFEEQLDWLQDRLEYATKEKAKQIFVFGHYPWFLYHEDEDDDRVLSTSSPPVGWGEYKYFEATSYEHDKYLLLFICPPSFLLTIFILVTF